MGDFTALCTRCKSSASTRIIGLGSLKGKCNKCGKLVAVGVYRRTHAPPKSIPFNLNAKTNKIDYGPDAKGVNFIRARRQ